MKRIGAVAVSALLASSCVPSEATPSLPDPQARAYAIQDIPREPTVFDTETLLRRLDLQVAPADLPASDARLPALLANAPSFLAAAQSPDDASRAIECMTAAIYHEARSEPLAGQRAVAQVVMNRVRDRAFPNSVCGVVYQGAERRTGCQFSFTCDGSLDRPRDPLSWARARTVATQALDGAGDPSIGAATHYHTTAILPWWAPSLRRIGIVGHHVFYRWAAPLERALSFRQTYAGVEPGTVAAVDPASDVATAIEAAVDQPAQLVQGVSIHRTGQASAHGVRVHRGLGTPMAAEAASVEAPATTAVKVHRGTPPAPVASETTAG